MPRPPKKWAARRTGRKAGVTGSLRRTQKFEPDKVIEFVKQKMGNVKVHQDRGEVVVDVHSVPTDKIIELRKELKGQGWQVSWTTNALIVF